MGKYLHHYTNEAEFQDDYNGTGPITAFTVISGMVCTACNTQEEQATPFDGKKFVFDRELGPTNVTICGGGPTLTMENIKIFKNGDDEIQEVYDDGDGTLERQGQAYVMHDLANAMTTGDYILFADSFEYGEGPYREPWVSYTEGKRAVIKGRYEGSGDIFDFYAEGEFELKETGSKDITFNCRCQ